MKNMYIFSARETLVDGKKWLWLPSLHALSGKNLRWEKGFKTKKEAISYMIRNLKIIERDYF